VGNVKSKESERAEGAKRTPYGRSAGGAEVEVCSGEGGADGTCVSILCGRGIEDEARVEGRAGEYRAIS
jgi:hypothetical protein